MKEQALVIISPIAGLKVDFTKTQLIDILKGNKGSLQKKNTNHMKLEVLVGKLKNESRDTLSALIDKMVEKNLLLMKFKKGARGFSYKLLSPCSQLQLRAVDSIMVKQQKKASVNPGYMETKPEKGSMFNDYLDKKFKSCSFDL